MAFLSDHLSHLLDRLEGRYERGSLAGQTTSTGLRLVDQAGGIGPGGWLICGRPGTGTTAMAVTFVVDLALRPGRPVIHFVTADLAPEELTIRLLGATLGLPVDRLKSGVLRPEDWARLPLGVRSLTHPDIRVTDARAWSEPELEMWCTDERPSPGSATSWLVIDGLDRLGARGVLSLPRLERIAGRRVVATTRDPHLHVSAAALITTIGVGEAGHLYLTIDRGPDEAPPRRRIGLSIHAASLRVRDHGEPQPGPGQLQLEVR